ncbi:sugar ABC transporter permease, partial [Yersinia pestis]|nr:sugar ABC transporter permease [Yersinia pestis]
STQFVGLNNWNSVSSDELFWRSLFNVNFNQVIFVLLSFELAMGMAMLLNEIPHFGGLFRTIMIIPVITSITVAMII